MNLHILSEFISEKNVWNSCKKTVSKGLSKIRTEKSNFPTEKTDDFLRMKSNIPTISYV